MPRVAATVTAVVNDRTSTTTKILPGGAAASAPVNAHSEGRAGDFG